MRGLVITVILLAGTAQAQDRGTTGRTTREGLSLDVYQDTLAALGKTIMSSSFSPDRIEANYQFIKILVDALQQPGSFSFPFDSVQNMRVLYPSDSTFRVMSWYVDRGNASYRFYGAIQMNQPDLKLFGLVDHGSEFAHPEDTTASYETWYGAYYYELIPAGSDEKPHYVLLGWNGGTPGISRRVIDVLHFREGEPVFGLPVFHTAQGVKNRIVFRYSSRASMMLDYLPAEKTIVFDHLVPFSESQQGNFEFYGPDLSYDGFVLQNGQWMLRENLELKNEGNQLDKFFNDPEKMQNEPSFKLPEEN